MAAFRMRWESSQRWRYVSPIDWAAAKGQVEVVKELLRMDPNLFRKLTSRKRNKRIESMWDEASCLEARKGRAVVAKELLRESAYTIDVHGGWALFLAAAAADVGMVESLLASKPELASGQGEYKSVDLLTAAAQGGSVHILKLLLDLHPNSCTCKEAMSSTIHAAALGGNVDMLHQVLLVADSSLLSSTNSHGASVLDAAASSGRLQMVQHLLQLQPEMIKHRDSLGNTVLHAAAGRGHANVVEELLKADPDLIAQANQRGDTALHAAVYGPFQPPGEKGAQRALEVVRCLMAARQDLVSCTNREGRTPLHFAVGFSYSFSADIVRTLLQAPGVDACAEDKEGMTALDVARASLVSEEAIEQLRAAGVPGGRLKMKEEDQGSQSSGTRPRRPTTARLVSSTSMASSEDNGSQSAPIAARRPPTGRRSSSSKRDRVVQELSPSMSVITNPISDLNLQISGDGSADEPASAASSSGLRRAEKLQRAATFGGHKQAAQGGSYPVFIYQAQEAQEAEEKKSRSRTRSRSNSMPVTTPSRRSTKMYDSFCSVSKAVPACSISFQHAAELQLDRFTKEMQRQRVQGGMNTSLLLAALLALINFLGLVAPFADVELDATAYYIFYLADAFAFMVALFVLLLLLTLLPVPVDPLAVESVLGKGNKLLWVAGVSTVIAFITAVKLVAGESHPGLAWAISAMGILLCLVQLGIAIYVIAVVWKKKRASVKNELPLYYHKDVLKQLASPAHQLNSKIQDRSDKSIYATGGDDSNNVPHS